MDAFRSFREIWFVDTEFRALDGERPEPVCLCARELRSGRTVRQWLWDVPGPIAPPFDLDADSHIVAYYASAEFGVFRSLDWPMPARALDLFAEFRNLANGLAVPCGSGLLGALAYFGLDALDGMEKESMRALAMRGGPYCDQEQAALLDYCMSDVDVLAKLFLVMAPKIDLPRALLRGRYMTAAARMEWNGVPIDREALEELRSSWDTIKSDLTRKIDADYGVYVPTNQRTINPDTPAGSAILREAAEWNIDPQRLADAVEFVHAQEC